MKITDVTLTLFDWEGIPALSYGAHAAQNTGRSRLGLLTIRPDEGIEGYGFLGSATNPADSEAGALMRALNPRIMVQDPLDRG